LIDDACEPQNAPLDSKPASYHATVSALELGRLICSMRW
jgi:hypothetical protein